MSEQQLPPEEAEQIQDLLARNELLQVIREAFAPLFERLLTRIEELIVHEPKAHQPLAKITEQEPTKPRFVTVYRRKGEEMCQVEVEVRPGLTLDGSFTDEAVHPDALELLNQESTHDDRVKLIEHLQVAKGSRLQEFYRLLNAGQRISFILQVERQF